MIAIIGIIIFSIYFHVPKQNGVFATIHNKDEIIKKIDEEIKSNMETHNIPGMSFALVDANGILYSNSYGTLDIIDDSLKINENTNFHIGSLSKVFVSLAIVKLEEEKRININDPLVVYLPWFSTKEEHLSNQITIKHLLSHSSGLPDRLNVHEIEQTDKQDMINEINKKLRNVRLVGKPGELHEYTNMNTDLLQLVIEEVTGETFTTYMNNNIFSPLGMERTGYHIFDHTHLSNTAMGHHNHWNKLKPYKEELVYATSGSAGMSSNVNDLSKFIQVLLNDGISLHGDSIISPSSLDEMFHPVQSNMAYNWYIYPHNMHMDGGLPGFTSTMVISKDRTFGLVLLANSKQHITLLTGFNLYRIVDGQEPVPILISDYSKLNSNVKILLALTGLFSILLLVIVWLTMGQLVKKRRKFFFVKPDFKKIGISSIIIAVYLGVFYYLHVHAPFIIGVPTIFAFKMEPNLVSAILIFTIVYTIFSVVLLIRIFLIQKPYHVKKQHEISM